MRKFLSFLFVCGMIAPASVLGQGAPIDLWVTTGFSSLHNRTWNQFSDSYNGYLTGLIDKPLNGFGLGMGANWGASVVIGDEISDDNSDIIEFSLFASNQRGKDQVTFTDDTKRVFDLRRHFVGFEMGVGGRFKKFCITGSWGFLLGNSILKSYMVYPGGIESYGMETTFNGVYDSFNGAGFLGAKATYRLGQFKAIAHFTWGGDLFKRAYFSDYNMARTLNVTQGTWPAEIPTDLPGWVNSTQTNVPYDGDNVENRFMSFGLQFGIAYSFVRE